MCDITNLVPSAFKEQCRQHAAHIDSGLVLRGLAQGTAELGRVMCRSTSSAGHQVDMAVPPSALDSHHPVDPPPEFVSSDVGFFAGARPNSSSDGRPNSYWSHSVLITPAVDAGVGP